MPQVGLESGTWSPNWLQQAEERPAVDSTKAIVITVIISIGYMPTVCSNAFCFKSLDSHHLLFLLSYFAKRRPRFNSNMACPWDQGMGEQSSNPPRLTRPHISCYGNLHFRTQKPGCSLAARSKAEKRSGWWPGFGTQILGHLPRLLSLCCSCLSDLDMGPSFSVHINVHVRINGMVVLAPCTTNGLASRTPTVPSKGQGLE